MAWLRRVLNLSFIASLTACGGGSNVSSGMTPGGSALFSDTPLAEIERAPDTSKTFVYLTNGGENSITVYGAYASGNAAPLYTIAGSNTQLDGPEGLCEDAAGNLYVANGTSSIIVFAHGARGNVAPLRVISGSATLLASPWSIAVDQTTGKLFALDFGSTPGPELLKFAAGTGGNEAPTAFGNVFPQGYLVSDSTGKNVIISGGACCSTQSDGIFTYPKQFSNGATLATVYLVSAFNGGGIADDPATKTYLVSSGGLIYRLAENTVGHGAEPGSPQQLTPAPVSTLTANCGSLLVLGPGRDVFAACYKQLVVYGPNATGNAKPLRTLNTALIEPQGLYVGP